MIFYPPHARFVPLKTYICKDWLFKKIMLLLQKGVTVKKSIGRCGTIDRAASVFTLLPRKHPVRSFTSRLNNESCASWDERKVWQNNAKVFKGRSVSVDLYSGIGVLFWTCPIQVQQGDMGDIFPVVFIHHNMDADKTCCFQRAIFLPSVHLVGDLWARRIGDC